MQRLNESTDPTMNIETKPARSSPPWVPAVYFVIGQAAWFACVLSAARGISWLGVAFTLALIVLHVARVARPLEEVKFIATVAVVGGAWDTALIQVGLLSYPHDALFHGLAPVWIVALWASFAAQFNTTYQWLKTRVPAGVLLGAIAGPLSFRAGAALGALRFDRPIPALVALAIGWAVLLPVATLLSRRWDGVSRSVRRDRRDSTLA